MRILAACENWQGSCAFACADAMRRSGHSVTIVSQEGFLPVGWRSVPLRGLRQLLTRVLAREYGAQLLREARALQPDLFFAFKGTDVSRSLVEQIKALGAAAINYYPDVSFTAHGSEIPAAMPAYDWVFTTKSYGVADMKRVLGVERVSFLAHGYDRQIHVPVLLDAVDEAMYACDAAFIGTWSLKKQQLLDGLVARCPGIDLKIWGAQWQRAPASLSRYVMRREVIGREYAKAIAATSINIAILSEARAEASSGDRSTTRTFEIPACGGFMLHERTTEADALFKEGEECAMFEGADELAAKVTHYLAQPEERRRIAEEGHDRAVTSHYAYDDRVVVILEKAAEIRASRRVAA
jgi:spore maturation protein CgeB